jgi:hypothetical protein
MDACERSVGSFEDFTAMMFQVEVLWVVTPCSVFVEVHAASIFRQHGTLKRWCPRRHHNPEKLDLRQIAGRIFGPDRAKITKE